MENEGIIVICSLEYMPRDRFQTTSWENKFYYYYYFFFVTVVFLCHMST